MQAFQFPFVAFKRNRGAYIWGRLPDSESGRVIIQRARFGASGARSNG